MRRVVVAAAAVLALAACAAPAAPSAAAPAPSNRPRTIPMQGVDPCSVFSPELIEQLGMGGSRLTPASSANANVPQCVWSSADPYVPSSGVYVQAVTYLGVDEMHARAQGSTFVDVRGFRAVEYDNSATAAGQTSCAVYVDVADGQAFQVAYDFPPETAAGRTSACPTAVRLAGDAISHLLSRQE